MKLIDLHFRELGLRAPPNDFNLEKHARAMENEILNDDFYGAEKSRLSPQKFVVDQILRLNEDQREAFDQISAALNGSGARRLFFVEGAGGCGTSIQIIFLLLSFSICF